MKNIAFWDNQLCERGTTVALYDYAYYNEKILGNKSFIFYDKNNRDNNQTIIDKFKKSFTVYETDNFKEVDSLLLMNKITHIYIIKSGEKDTRISKVAKNCIHCVFNCYQPHGEVYSSIAPWVRGNNGRFPVVPHMINLPINNDDTNMIKNMRNRLNIPVNATVFGGYGGKDSFSIGFVHKVVYAVAKNNPNIYFLFANFNQFCPRLPNIIHIATIYDLNHKVEFINTCDAMLWARKDGETFGLAIGEFSIMNKPVITMKIGDLCHVNLLKDKGIWYSNPDDLFHILINFNKEIESKKDWNAYKEYTPEKVMTIFKQIYLD